jgi:tetratricopeptide (TPR) repeat protein
MRKIKVTLLFLLFTSGLFSQNYFNNYKDGETNFKKKDYPAAITEFSQVIEKKIDHYKAYNYRGLSYIETKEYDKAIVDFKKAIEFKPKVAEYHFGLGKANYLDGKFDAAIIALNTAIERDKKMMEAYQYKLNSHIALKQFQKAVDVGVAAVAKAKTAKNYYALGVAQDSLMHFDDAVYSFGRARFYDSKMVGAYIGLAYTHMQLKDYAKALEAADKSMSLDEKNTHALLVRADIHVANSNLQKAIDDISKIILFNPDVIKYYVQRGNTYQKLAQHQNAIADYSKALKMNDKDYKVYYIRATSYEAMSNYTAAKEDYEQLKKLAKYDGEALRLYDDAKKRLYELNKESNNPEIVIIDPISLEEGIMQIKKNSELYTLKGQIIDASTISFIKVEGKDAVFNKDTINPFFQVDMNVKDLKSITITAFDAYQNSESWTYKLMETEVDAPIVKLMAPYASDDGTVYLDSDDPTLYVEGVIKDATLIKSILIEGATASYVLDQKNPKFSATINIMNKDGFTVIAEDKFGNKVEKKYVINRENVALLADNPMGKTWVIFIENSGYKSFASLDGPTKDVTMMKSAFAKYKIHNVVHKKNMTKSQIERFFSIELRDLVRSNRVNSLLVWYAGHGKFINETGYWIPTDANRDDEFTYFNINNLKASMQSYSKFITHTLVITDACESGPSFYQAMRSTPKARSCNDWQATKFKSSQVFSSAGYELASDNSQFTKTFANTLSSNPNSCIPIETIVSKVKTAVSKGGAKQKPKFGKIAGLEDENGTFFFIKK